MKSIESFDEISSHYENLPEYLKTPCLRPETNPPSSVASYLDLLYEDDPLDDISLLFKEEVY